MLLLIVAAAWAVAAGATYAVARWTSFGPVVVRLSAGGDVHVAEVAVLLLAGTNAAVVTVACALTLWGAGRMDVGSRPRPRSAEEDDERARDAYDEVTASPR